MRLLPILPAIALLLALPAMAQPTAAALRAGLAGQWAGTLGYRDYQSNRMQTLPVQTVITLAGDGVTQIRASVFDEGAAARPVHITAISIDDATAGTVSSANARAGRAMEMIVETAKVTRHAGPTDWQIIYTRTGRDGDTDADIRITETRAGNSLVALKEVKPAGSPDSQWAMRNETRLTRTP